MSNSRKRAFKVCVDLPDDVSEEDMIDYIEDAVRVWKGQLRPPTYDGLELLEGDPLFYLDSDSVKVSKAYPDKHKKVRDAKTS